MNVNEKKKFFLIISKHVTEHVNLSHEHVPSILLTSFKEKIPQKIKIKKKFNFFFILFFFFLNNFEKC